GVGGGPRRPLGVLPRAGAAGAGPGPAVVMTVPTAGETAAGNGRDIPPGPPGATVVIAGGGPVGLTLAIELGQQGVRCELVDKRPRPGRLPKMERCNARTMEHFRRMGIADRVRAAGLRDDIPMDVFIVLSLVEPPLLHLPYPSVKSARAEIRACSDGSMPLEPYQLISQYT